MTDTYVENKIIEHLMKLDEFSGVLKCIKYFNENKENPDSLPGFDEFKPEYVIDPSWSEEEIADYKEHTDGPYILAMRIWFTAIYIYIKGTTDTRSYTDPVTGIKYEYTGSPEFDELYDAVYSTVLNTDIKDKDSDLTSIRRSVELYDDNGDLVEIPLYPEVAFPNEDFIRPIDDNGSNLPWYELYFIPSRPNQIELGTKGRSRWFGLMQVNVCVPKTWGTQELYQRYDDIAALFRSGLILEGVRIVRTYRSSALDDDDFYCLPVTIEWQADLDR